MIEEMIATPRMVFWCFSIVLPVHVTDLYRRQSVCLLCFECIDGLPLDLVMHSYGNPLTRHETEATPSGKVLCRRAKSLDRTRQSPYRTVVLVPRTHTSAFGCRRTKNRSNRAGLNPCRQWFERVK